MTEDEELVRRVLAGDTNAYASLVRKYQGRVRGHCYHMLRCDPDDVSQEIFIKAFRALKNFRGEASFSTWLYRIVVNQCKDELKKKKFIKGEGGELSVAVNVAIPVEEAQLLQRILNELPDAYREILILKEYQQLSYEEIAKTLEVSIDSVKAKIRRARARAIQIKDKITSEEG